jgi:CheY-like chemotaxis protein
MGIRALRVNTGREASEIIRLNAIHIAVVDLGLPLDATPAAPPAPPAEEGGPRLLDLLAHLSQPPPTVVIKRTRTHRDDSREIAAALRAGAFAVIDRPRTGHDLELLLEVLRRCLLRHYRGRWPGLS